MSDGSTDTTYVYDGGGSRIKRIVDDGTTVTTTIYVAGMEIELVDAVESQRTVYYGGGGAFRIIGGSDAGLYYRHADHLGSTSVVSDSTGAKRAGSEVVFAPFGEIRAGSQSPLTDSSYTGQRVDASTDGLMYYGARYYLPELRRFISADSMIPGAANPQVFNRYAYALNNPVNLIDPSGHVTCPPGMSSSECAAMTAPVTAHNPNEKVQTTTQSTAPNQLASRSQANLAAADARDTVVSPASVGGSGGGHDRRGDGVNRDHGRGSGSVGGPPLRQDSDSIDSSGNYPDLGSIWDNYSHQDAPVWRPTDYGPGVRIVNGDPNISDFEFV